MLLHCTKCRSEVVVEGPTAVCPACGTTVSVEELATVAPPSHSAPPPLAADSPPAARRSAAASLVALHIGGYDILGEIGRGGMGMVLEGWQKSLRRKVAIKVLAPHLVQDASLLARFQREVAALVKLSHPNIVAIFDQGRSAEGLVYFIMEYVEGKAGGPPSDLQRLIAGRALDVPTTRRLILQVLRALDFAHQQRIIHRDIKPANIMVDRHGNAKVTDFGIAAMETGQQGQHLTMEAATMGTMAYMAPEQLRDAASADERADVYSTGVMLYEMLTGERPMGAYRRPSTIVAGLDTGWDEVLDKALQPRREDRLQSMAEFARLIEHIGEVVSPTEVMCPQCSARLSPTDQFCLKCGLSLWIECPKCRVRVVAGANFCPQCRTDVQAHRSFLECFELGRRCWRQAQESRSPGERLRQAEEAGLALTKALTFVPDHAEARHLRQQANHLQRELAWQVGETALRDRKYGEARGCYEQLLELEPRNDGARTRLEQIAHARAQMLAKVQHLLAQGQMSQAVETLALVEKSFGHDPEISGLRTQYAEKLALVNAALRERIPVLEREQKWYELSLVLAELQQSGVTIAGIEQYADAVRQRLTQAEQLLVSARSFLAKGRRAQAGDVVRQALALVSDHVEAQQLLEEASRQEPVRIFTGTYAGSILAGVTALLLCAGAYLLSWSAISVGPNESRTDCFWATQGAAADIAQRQLPDRHRYWPLAVILGITGLIGSLLPARRLRGPMLAATAVAGGCAWLWVVRQICLELQAWMPLARFLKDPIVLANWIPPEPSLGPAVWLTVAACLVLAVGSALNLCQSGGGLLTLACAGAVWLAAGAVFLSEWPGRQAPDVTASLELSKPAAAGSRSGLKTSGLRPPEVSATITLLNRGKRLLTVVPANEPAEGGVVVPHQESNTPGRWIEARGVPDLIVSLQRSPEDGASSDERTSVSPRFGEGGHYGCLLRPNEVVRLLARFAPVWKPGRSQRPTMSGSWALRLLGSSQVALVSNSFEVPGVPNPDDERLTKAEKQLEHSQTQVKAWVDELQAAASSPSRSDQMVRIQRLVSQAQEVSAAVSASREAAAELSRGGMSPSREVQQNVTQQANETLPAAQWLARFHEELSRAASTSLVKSLNELGQAAWRSSPAGMALQKLAPTWVVDHATVLSQSRKAWDLIGFAAGLSSSLIGDKTLSDKIGPLLETAITQCVTEQGVCLIGPDGGRAARSGTADLQRVLDQVVTWSPNLRQKEDFAYARLLTDLYAGKLTAAQVNEFAAANPRARSDELACWLGLQSLRQREGSAAAAQFERVLKSDAGGAYRPLAEVGQALCTLAATSPELLPRLAAERQVASRLAQRKDWSSDLRSMLPPSVIAGEDLEWLDRLQTITKVDQWNAWKTSPGKTIPWLQLGKDPSVIGSVASEARKAMDNGASVFVDGALFAVIAEMALTDVPPALLTGEARPVRVWGEDHYQYPFFTNVNSIGYEVQTTRAMVPAAASQRFGKTMRPLLSVGNDYYVSIARRNPRSRGLVVYLPDRIVDTPAGRRFLKNLVEHSLKVVGGI